MWLAVLLLMAGAAIADDRWVDTIDLSVSHQTIDYFAASDCWSIQKIGGWSAPNKQKIADLLFSQDKGIGLSGWRFNLAGGIENSKIGNPWRTGETFEVSRGKYDWTRCANQRWFLAAAKALGVKHFVAFCITPPRRLTQNGLTCADDNPNITNNLKPGMERQFGAYLGDILMHFRRNPEIAEQIDFGWLSPINEPQWDWIGGQEGTRASNLDILRQYRAIHAELESRNLPTCILGPESGAIPDLWQLNSNASKKYKADYGDYVDLLCGAPDLSGVLHHTIAYHSYWSDSPDTLINNRQKLAAKMAQHPLWHAAETEYCIMEPHRDLTMDAAIRVMQVIHADLTIVNATSWSWWLAVSNGNYKDGLIFTDWKKPGDEENVIPSKLLWAMGNYSRFVRSGMVRVEIKSSGAAQNIKAVFGSAYRDPTGRNVVAVYINASNTPASLTLSVMRAKGARWIPYLTSDKPGDDLRALPAFSAEDAFTLPARSVVTFVREG